MIDQQENLTSPQQQPTPSSSDEPIPGEGFMMFVIFILLAFGVCVFVHQLMNRGGNDCVRHTTYPYECYSRH